jgi:hypothetical protein
MNIIYEKLSECPLGKEQVSAMSCPPRIPCKKGLHGEIFFPGQ